MKARGDKKLDVALQIMSVLNWLENIVGYQHFLLFPQCFQKFSLQGL